MLAVVCTNVLVPNAGESIKAKPRLASLHLATEMRCHWLCLIFLMLLLDQLARQAAAQRTRRRNNSNNNQVQSRIVSNNNNNVRGNTRTRRSAVQSRIVDNSSSNSSNRNRNRNRRARLRNRRARNRRNRNRSSSNRSSSSSSSSTGVSARIVDNSAQARIVQGSTTRISRMPYLVQVHRGSETFCGGSLIAIRWVLSAAHCTYGYSASNFYVIAGTRVLNGTDGVTADVTYLANAPRFTTRRMNMDASLLKVDRDLSGTNIAVIAMARRRPRAGVSVLIGGWGATREGGSAVRYLRSTRVNVVAQQRCKNEYQGTSTITRYMFCAGSSSKDTCSGDSGGSVVRRNRLVGITSFGLGCARSGYPGVYTNVPAMINWVNRVMANN